jgi:hypothetical protein
VVVLNEEGKEIATAKPISETCTDRVICLGNMEKSEKIALKFELMSAKLY